MTPAQGKVLARKLRAAVLLIGLSLPCEHRYVIDTGIEIEHPEFQGRMYDTVYALGIY
jgi:hypothetical protein